MVDDNSSMRLGMVESLRRDGYVVREFDKGSDALAAFRQRTAPVVITDLKMNPITGLDVLREIKQLSPQTEIMVVSAFGTVDTAVEAMQLGAADFMTKPFSAEELRFRVGRLCEKIDNAKALAKLQEEYTVLQHEVFKPYEKMIGQSTLLRQVFELVERVAQEDSTVLIEGESGTGKELIARALHQRSRRKDRPFIKVNCGSLADSLLESELFGHEKGAFTGAVKRKKGRFELADGGTLFLDEIGDISATMQVKLLRALQEKEFERVGGEETISVNVRIISATHRSLTQMVQQEKFREDLFYRLRVIPIQLPPLRERKEDIPLLATHFLNELSGSRHETPKKISSEGMNLLTQYFWPGNIRELQNLMERLWVISDSGEIDEAMIAQHLSGSTGRVAGKFDHLPLEQALEAFEKTMILQAMKKTGQVKNQAAKLLGIPASSLYYKLEKYGLL